LDKEISLGLNRLVSRGVGGMQMEVIYALPVFACLLGFLDTFLIPFET